MRHYLLLGVAAAALFAPAAASAQTTGTTDFDKTDIVVTGQRSTDVAGTQIPDTPKTRVVLTQKFISRQTAGQSIDEIINQLPGVSFQNQDPFGSSGGRLTIRGFGPDRISQTLDGVPVNDTGNYALYSNQQVDPELIDQVNVSLGSTDIDSPTASASGSTVNYRTLVPTDEFGARMVGSLGDFSFFRVFGLVNTGTFTSFGTKAWISASHASNDVVYSNFGDIDKTQYNFKLYQPLGGNNGDFISLAGNWNVNRNTNAPDLPLRNDLPVPLGFPQSRDARFFTSPRCTVDTPQTGVADAPNGCGSLYEQNVNPSNTGSLRLNSKFTLADKLTLTVDGFFQYTKANGGQYGVYGYEQAGPGGFYGSLASGSFTNYYTGIDLNGDGDLLDQVYLDGTSQTVTHRYSLSSSLRYDFSDSQSVRLVYAHDYGRHRQSGELGYLRENGQPTDVFPINDPIYAANGGIMEKRNRKSYAILDQVSGEYRGKFFDDRLVISAGVRAPFFKRNLHNYCFTTTASGGVNCIAGDDADNAAYAAAHPYVYTPATDTAAGKATGYLPPQFRQFKYDKLLPSGGVTYKFTDAFQFYASYSKGLQVPGTDNLYQSFYNPQGVQDPVPEVTDNFDAGLRYTSSKIQAQVGPWYTIFTNRLASSYDPILDITTYRNLGKVDKYGVDGSISWQPIRQLSLYAFGSYLKSKIKDDVVGGQCSASNVTFGTFGCTTAGTDYTFQTSGKREAGAPVYTFGGRAQVDLDPISFGAQAKRTGKRYVNDQNLPIYTNADITNPTTLQVYGAAAPAYTVVDLDARLSMAWAGLNDKTYIQLNVMNVFDELYVGNLGNAVTSYNSVPYVYIGPPRTFVATLNVAF